MSLNISWLDSITNKVINPSAIQDLVFRTSVLTYYLRRNAFGRYVGGVSMDNAFLNEPMIGGAFSLGEPLSTDVIDPIAGATFTPRQYNTTVGHWMERLATNRGPAAVFNALSVKHRAAMNTLNTIWNIAFYHHGQSNVSGISDSRIKHTNGLDEAVNDGITQGPWGNTYAAYGGQTRGSDVAEGYNSIPYFCGNSSTGAAGQITYHHLVQSNLRYTKGSRAPKIGLTTKPVFGFLLERIQAQQLFQFNTQMGTEAHFGADSIKFRNADIVIDEYCPGKIEGVNSPRLGNYLTANYTANSTNAATTFGAQPADGSSTVNPGETFWWLNPETWKFMLSDHPFWDFGWGGYIPTQNSTKIVGRIYAMGTLKCEAPWLNGVMFGING